MNKETLIAKLDEGKRQLVAGGYDPIIIAATLKDLFSVVRELVQEAK